MPELIPHLTSRLHFIKVSPDYFRNIELWHCLSVFENYVYGVFSQYERIKENNKIKMVKFNFLIPIPQCN